MHTIEKTKGSKEEQYQALLPQIEGLITWETDPIANLANVSSALQDVFGFWWTGFYFVKKSLQGEGEELVLGPFQGPVACTRIGYGKGVCGTAWKEKKTQVVKDVEEFPGHIACSSLSRSEIVVPLILPDGSVYGVLDIDSAEVGTFDEVDKENLEKLASIICKTLN